MTGQSHSGSQVEGVSRYPPRWETWLAIVGGSKKYGLRFSAAETAPKAWGIAVLTRPTRIKARVSPAGPWRLPVFLGSVVWCLLFVLISLCSFWRCW
jgi:hypothetical protein